MSLSQPGEDRMIIEAWLLGQAHLCIIAANSHEVGICDRLQSARLGIVSVGGNRPNIERL
jgi:hypothetical protein